MTEKLQPNAPRFHTLWESREDRRIFIFKKADWRRLSLEDGDVVLLDLNEMNHFPLRAMSLEPDFLAAVAERKAGAVQISVYRQDLEDPQPINVDFYEVWVSPPRDVHIKIDEMVETADTDYNLNFQRYLQDHVFIVKNDAGDDHWLEELPQNVLVLIENVP